MFVLFIKRIISAFDTKTDAKINENHKKYFYHDNVYHDLSNINFRKKQRSHGSDDKKNALSA